jgi:hypothetical protein
MLSSQNFWSSVCHLVTGNEKKVQGKHVPDDMVWYFKGFKKIYPSIIYRTSLIKGLPDALAEGCKELGTIYTDMIVENFERRLLSFLFYILQTRFVVILFYFIFYSYTMSNIDLKHMTRHLFISLFLQKTSKNWLLPFSTRRFVKDRLCGQRI